jgi:hypothetical protein
VRQAFQIVKYGFSGGCHLIEILYGRKFNDELLNSQPIKQIVMECLLHDDELEKEYIQKSEDESKKTSGRNLIVGSRNVQEILFEMQYPEYHNAVVTLLTTEEYEKEIAESKNNNRNIS